MPLPLASHLELGKALQLVQATRLRIALSSCRSTSVQREWAMRAAGGWLKHLRCETETSKETGQQH